MTRWSFLDLGGCLRRSFSGGSIISESDGPMSVKRDIINIWKLDKFCVTPIKNDISTGISSAKQPPGNKYIITFKKHKNKWTNKICYVLVMLIAHKLWNFVNYEMRNNLNFVLK